ncbi:hypothetical protein [Burkholderia multivorans]|uniref:hypothetical protein n=1 Tax=Burkholderia multivorans TaxID=87883 RepID=UPI0021BF77A4|nr:hypothetical protein [Burkholderia multivorans]
MEEVSASLRVPRDLCDGLALRYRISLEEVRRGTTWLGAAVCIGELLFLTAWLAHMGNGALSRTRVVRLEKHLRYAVTVGKQKGKLYLSANAFREFVELMETHERQLASSPIALLHEGMRLMDSYRHEGVVTPERLQRSEHGV